MSGNIPDYTPPAPTWLMRQLWKASGADPGILALCPYTEHVKFACLGGIVLSTGVLAAIAGGYALYTIFAPHAAPNGTVTTSGEARAVALAILFGAIWGTIIFNLDRYIVASTGKGDGTEAITRQELKNAAPRILLGLIIAVTISKPLEIKIFEKEIEASLPSYQEGLANREVARVIAGDTTQARAVAELNRQREAWLSERAATQSVLARIDSLITEEIRDGNGSGQRTCGKACKDMQAEQSRVTLDLKRLDSLVAGVTSSLAGVQKRDETLKAEYVTKYRGYDGFKARMHLAHEAAGWWVTAFIMVLFAAVELTPILFKLMMVKGPYEYVEENIKEATLARQGIQRTHDLFPVGAGADGTQRFFDLERVTFHHPRQVVTDTLKRIRHEQEVEETRLRTWAARRTLELERELAEVGRA